jgi:hypothetical protein
MKATLRAIFVICLLVGALLAPTAVAQETTASIRGSIVDAAGAPVADAKVDILDTRTGNMKTLNANADGVFLATRLSPGGPYLVIVDDQQTVSVESLSVAEIYNLKITMDPTQFAEVLSVTASQDFVEVATGPAATFDSFKMETAVNFSRDIVDVFGNDPRVNIDNGDRSVEVNCAGKHARFNSVTLDGVGQNDRFGLNTNGYSTATGMPFPYDAIAQLAVELAPADVTYGGFSACTINAVTKSGTNEFKGNAFYEYTDEGLKGTKLGGEPGDFSSPPFESTKQGFTLGGKLMADRLHFFGAYEATESPRFLAHGYVGSGNGVERPWLSQADHDRIVSISNSIYGYDPGGLPGDGVQEEDKQMLKLDWNVQDRHNLSAIYNYYDGFQDRGSDSDSNEFEFPNHYYVKGAESTTTTVRLSSQWGDAVSTEVFFSNNTMDDSQVTKGPKDFGDFQINIGNNTVYLGADDSRQANSLNTETDYAKISAQLLKGRNVFTAGYELEKNDIFNIFVQHSRGGEWDFYDDSLPNEASSVPGVLCAALTAQGRFDDPACTSTGIDLFELGRPQQIYYGSGGGTNDPNDAAASFGNTLNSIYLQDEIFLDERNMTVAAGVRYEFFTSSDNPTFNQAFTDANGGLRNDANLDGLSLVMPRLGVIWSPKPQMSVRGSIGRFGGGNPNVWVSNAWSNDGVTNVQTRVRNFSGAGSVLDGTIPLTGPNPGRDIPQAVFDQVAATTAADASTAFLVLIDPNYKQPFEDKLSLGLSYRFNSGYQVDFDYLHTEFEDSALYVDVSQDIVGTTLAGGPIYDSVRGINNFMLTNSGFGASSDILSVLVAKRWDSGLDVSAGYAHVDGEDVSPMTSFVAASNFFNLATSDINNPRPGTSNYVVPHRFSLRASLGREFFDGYETRFTVFGYVQAGQPGSFTMEGGEELEAGRSTRHLLYIPTGADDPNVVFADGFQTQQFFNWVERHGFGPGFVARNTHHAKWTNRLDFGVTQDFPLGSSRVNGRAFVKIYNFANFLNDDWGKVYDAEFESREIVDIDLNAAGQYVFKDFNDRPVTNLLEFRSLYEIRWGVELRF